MAGPMGDGGFGGGIYEGTTDISHGIIDSDLFLELFERLYNSSNDVFAALNSPVSELFSSFTDGVGLIDFLLEHVAVPLLRWLPILDRTPLELALFSVPLVIVLSVARSVI